MNRGSSKRVQVLVAALNQDPESLLRSLNIQTPAIIANQCNENRVSQVIYNGHEILILNFNERGVGLNRNNALMRANSQYCLFADDDMTYVDGYENVVASAFSRHPKADILIFNLYEEESERYEIKHEMSIGWHNFMRFGAVRIAVKLSSIRSAGILFNLCFGGGCQYSHGEDTIFLADCLKRGLRIVAVPDYIATLNNQRPSTWNYGFTPKYLVDQGRLYKTIFPSIWKVIVLQDAIRHHERYGLSISDAYRAMVSLQAE